MNSSPATSVVGQDAGVSAPPAPASAEQTPAGATMGRPTRYDPKFCAEMIGYCSDGASLTSFAASIGVSRRTFKNWVDEHAEFADALDVAKGAATVWWETRARRVANGDGGPGAASMIQFALKNLAPDDFSDRREVQYTGAVNHNLLTYDQAVEEARRRGLPERVLIADHSDDEQ